ncbi:MAG: endonuclease/exonuclease/phosphatase family protein [Sedimentisphaerales bacterium]|nr:endonuclease/exonuclease/phosphatase family protein [Sedimentisphaerales bacterium]
MKHFNIIAALTVITALSGCNQQNKIQSREIQFSSEKQQEDCIKAMTFNVRTGYAWWLDGWTFNHWDNRRNIVIDTIADNAADVIAMQEGVHFQLKELQQALPQYSKYATGRIDGKNKGETCAIFYRNDRFELVDSGTFWFSKKPEKAGSKNWGNLFARICSWVLLLDKTNHTSFYVYNVHLDNWSQRSREKSVRLLAKRIADRDTKDPFILMGDFNMEIDNPAMKYLEQIRNQDSFAAMVNTWQSVHPDESRTGTYHKFSGSQTCAKIDHISISESAKTIDSIIDHHKLNGRYPSDHFPEIATIRLPTRQTASINW